MMYTFFSTKSLPFKTEIRALSRVFNSAVACACLGGLVVGLAGLGGASGAHRCVQRGEGYQMVDFVSGSIWTPGGPFWRGAPLVSFSL